MTWKNKIFLPFGVEEDVDGEEKAVVVGANAVSVAEVGSLVVFSVVVLIVKVVEEATIFTNWPSQHSSKKYFYRSK